MADFRPNTILPDANIWCSATLHSWFGLLAAETLGSWSFYWTEDILAEAVYHRRKRFPNAHAAQIDAMRDRLMVSMGENRISGYPIDPSVDYPDEFDAHVHSAAVHAGIAIIVSEDRKGFNSLYANPDDSPYEVLTADEFLMLVVDSIPQVVDSIITKQFLYWTSKGENYSFPRKLERAGAPKFAKYVDKRVNKLFRPIHGHRGTDNQSKFP